MNLAVIGAGYVGLVTAAVFAELGNRVWVIEIDEEKLAKLQKGEVPFYEPGLAELVLKNLEKKRLSFTRAYSKAVPGAEVIFVCVGTPTKRGKVDLSAVYEATRELAENLKQPAIVALKSTVPPGINLKLEEWMRGFTQEEFELVSVPEFLREGKALEDTLSPHRVIIGANNTVAAEKLLSLHRGIGGERLVCSPTSAQLIKYAANAFLPTKISFANSIAVLCDKLGAEVESVIKGLGMDRRIGPEYLKAGLGYGGSCFPKDIEALTNIAKEAGYDFRILKAVKKTNQAQIKYFVGKVLRLSGGSLKGRVLTILGLSFKPETSDIREASSLYLIKALKKLGAKIRATDPAALKEAKKKIKGVAFFADPYQALKGADALLLVTEWEEYQKLDFEKVGQAMRTRVVVDGRNVYNQEELEKLGFAYEGIGK